MLIWFCVCDLLICFYFLLFFQKNTGAFVWRTLIHDHPVKKQNKTFSNENERKQNKTVGDNKIRSLSFFLLKIFNRSLQLIEIFPLFLSGSDEPT